MLLVTSGESESNIAVTLFKITSTTIKQMGRSVSEISTQIVDLQLLKGVFSVGWRVPQEENYFSR